MHERFTIDLSFVECRNNFEPIYFESDHWQSNHLQARPAFIMRNLWFLLAVASRCSDIYMRRNNST